MNNENPLIPQGSLFEEKAKSQARVKRAFFFALSASVLTLLVALIAQGCKRQQQQLPPEPPAPPPTFDTSYTPVAETNQAPVAMDTNVAPTLVDTNPPPPPPVTPPPANEYTIEKGDSFYSIAKKFGVSMKAIADANPGVDAKRLQIGKKLNIPAPSAAPAAATSGATPAPMADPATAESYTVKSGDNLTKIAKKFGTTVNALRAANGLKTERIKVGDKLKIPAKATPPRVEPPPVVTPVNPTPVNPAPVNPAPVNPAPVNPAPVNPSPGR